jgi:hypothetical protein
MRGQGSLIAIPVARGAREVSLWFDTPAYGTGKAITWLSLLLIAGWIVAPPLLRRRNG